MPDTEARDRLVVVNDEDQYSLWWCDRTMPAGWTAVGGPRTEAECLGYIEEVWTDLRPRSLRERMAAAD